MVTIRPKLLTIFLINFLQFSFFFGFRSIFSPFSLHNIAVEEKARQRNSCSIRNNFLAALNKWSEIDARIFTAINIFIRSDVEREQRSIEPGKKYFKLKVHFSLNSLFDFFFHFHFVFIVCMQMVFLCLPFQWERKKPVFLTAHLIPPLPML